MALPTDAQEDARGTPEHAPHVGRPGPRGEVGGCEGFLTVSRLDWSATRNQQGFPPALFEAVHVFPDRMRWLFVPQGEDQSERRLVYRHGDEAFVLEPGASTSKRVEGVEWAGVVLQGEARRALMTYPEGFDWSPAEDGRRTAEVYAQSCCKGKVLGRLELELDGEARPRRVSVRGGQNQLLDSLVVEEWQDVGGRAFPRVLTLSQAGEEVWRETLGRVQLRFDRLDLFFTPVDRREASGQLVKDRVVKALDLRAITFRKSPLPTGLDWQEARRRAERLLEAARLELEGTGLALDPVPTFDLDARGSPLRVVLRLATYLSQPPDGWTSWPERPGQATLLERTGDVAGMLGLMAARVPAGTVAGTPYARLYDTVQGLRVELGFPLEPRR